MSIKKMTAVWETSQTKGTDRLVLLALADSANDAGVCWPSVATLAKKAATGERNVRKILNKLVELGELKIEPSHGKTNRYHVLPPLEHDPNPCPVDNLVDNSADNTPTHEPADTPERMDRPEPAIRKPLNHSSGGVGTTVQPNHKESKTNHLDRWLADAHPDLIKAFDDVGITEPTRSELARLPHVIDGGGDYIHRMVVSAENNIRLAIYRIRHGQQPPPTDEEIRAASKARMLAEFGDFIER